MLYRKYRPKTFAEIEGQQHIVQTLQGALASERIGHAYLFCGPRGTGKTTMARLFAKALNCSSFQPPVSSLQFEPCNQCFSCNEINQNKSLSLIEIDAASHTGVDNVREIIESAQVAAAGGDKKIFIIDEVHMLSKSAFNALLKTLEEPPAHTLFILATTEPHKVPETILSRVQRFDFEKLSSSQIIAKLQKIALAENLSIDGESLAMLATSARGSARDAESSLAKVMAFAGNEIRAEKTSAILGIIPDKVHAELLEAIISKNTVVALAAVARLHESGAHLENFSRQFIDYVRGKLLESVASPSKGSSATLVAVVQKFMEARSDLRQSPIPQLPLELAIISLTKHANLA